MSSNTKYWGSPEAICIYILGGLAVGFLAKSALTSKPAAAVKEEKQEAAVKEDEPQFERISEAETPPATHVTNTYDWKNADDIEGIDDDVTGGKRSRKRRKNKSRKSRSKSKRRTKK